MVAEERITIVDRRLGGEEISVAKGRQAIATEIGQQPSGKKNVTTRKDAGFF
jgi:hypothetical protein